MTVESNFLSVSDLHEVHKRLWTWMAEHPLALRSAWPEWKSNGGSIPRMINDCSACAAATRRSGESEICRYCPLDWGRYANRRKTCNAAGSLVARWWKLAKLEVKTDEETQKISELALRIANMQWEE